MEPRTAAEEMAEPVGTVGMMFYFGAESAAEAEKLELDVIGLYAGGRGGVIGEVAPAEVDEIFYFFKPGLVAGMVELSQRKASREQAVEGHLAAADAYARNTFGGIDVADLDAVSDAAELLFAGLPAGQWPIVDGYLALDGPSEPAERAYRNAIILRELRGGVHTDAVKAARMSGAIACQLDRGGAYYALHGYTDEDRVEETEALLAVRATVETETTARMAALLEVLSEPQRAALATGAALLLAATSSPVPVS